MGAPKSPIQRLQGGRSAKSVVAPLSGGEVVASPSDDARTRLVTFPQHQTVLQLLLHLASGVGASGGASGCRGRGGIGRDTDLLAIFSPTNTERTQGESCEAASGLWVGVALCGVARGTKGHIDIHTGLVSFCPLLG